ncbi:MAG: nitroreductase [Dehalococcoidia bacterium]|nr:nitroreductase [Dehalococcoidia bacterium]
MDVIEAINGRRSVRAFKADPIPKEVLQGIMEAALRAPSWENTQPWEFAVLGGEVMNELRAAVVAKMSAGEKPNLDIPWPKFSGPHLERAKTGGRCLLKELGIAKEDSEAIANWRFSMTQFFGAPNGVIVYMDASLGEWSVLDVGLAVENLMIAAWHYGVGTCALSAAVIYPDVLHSLLNIPESKRIILGLAVGYPDFESPAATYRADREPLETLVTWHGFD